MLTPPDIFVNMTFIIKVVLFCSLRNKIGKKIHNSTTSVVLRPTFGTMGVFSQRNL